MFKTINYQKVKWVKNITKEGGAMKEVIDNNKSSIILHSFTQKHGRMWGATDDPEQLLKLLEKNNGIYEVISKYPHKVYFDIDKETPESINCNQYLTDTKTTIDKYFPNATYAISGSVNQYKAEDKVFKTSYHIVLGNYIIHNEEERNYVKFLTKYLMENVDSGFDWKVYTPNRNMKCINQAKANDTRIQEIIECPDFKQHIITTFIGSVSLPFQPLPPMIEEEVLINKSKKSFDLSTLPKLAIEYPPEDFDLEKATAKEILHILPLNRSFDHSYTHRIARFCYYNDVSFDEFMAWLGNKHSHMAICIQMKWRGHFANMEKFPPVSITQLLPIIGKYYPKLVQDKSYKKF